MWRIESLLHAVSGSMTYMNKRGLMFRHPQTPSPFILLLENLFSRQCHICVWCWSHMQPTLCLHLSLPLFLMFSLSLCLALFFSLNSESALFRTHGLLEGQGWTFKYSSFESHYLSRCALSLSSFSAPSPYTILWPLLLRGWP